MDAHLNKKIHTAENDIPSFSNSYGSHGIHCTSETILNLLTPSLGVKQMAQIMDTTSGVTLAAENQKQLQFFMIEVNTTK